MPKKSSKMARGGSMPSAMKKGGIALKRGYGSDILSNIGSTLGGGAGKILGSFLPFKRGGRVPKRGLGGDLASMALKSGIAKNLAGKVGASGAISSGVADSIARSVGDVAEQKVRSLLGLKRGGRVRMRK